MSGEILFFTALLHLGFVSPQAAFISTKPQNNPSASNTPTTAGDVFSRHRLSHLPHPIKCPSPAASLCAVSNLRPDAKQQYPLSPAQKNIGLVKALFPPRLHLLQPLRDNLLQQVHASNTPTLLPLEARRLPSHQRDCCFNVDCLQINQRTLRRSAVLGPLIFRQHVWHQRSLHCR